ncbi:hypothetical protein GSH19_00700 [Lactobacillus sp. S2-2]|uniref:hypothetical protein n=1 Tax=Lactobacillus sp. S2-2 TaxID=2692917 RepID=UPI001F1C230E|nr:hypothetical protein [Lactobacillus sp. S2-2]MCF6514706.1 hypothetical protein [Lactobacillus sp. S2-2]
MSKAKELSKLRNNIIIDMNDFIIKYAENILDVSKNDLAEQIYEAAKDDVKGLDQLFNDNGYGRTTKYTDIAEGFLCNSNHVGPEEVETEAQKLVNEAIEYLGKNAQSFDQWRAE